MASNDQDFFVFAVRLLFERIREGRVKFVADQTPDTLQALEEVKFDKSGNPIYETIASPVRALANLVYAQELRMLEEEAEERERKSPVHDLLSEPTNVSDEVLATCVAKSSFTGLAFELYKETGVVVAVCSHV